MENTEIPPENPNFGSNGIFVTSTPMKTKSQENTIIITPNIPQNNNVPQNNVNSSNKDIPQNNSVPSNNNIPQNYNIPPMFSPPNNNNPQNNGSDIWLPYINNITDAIRSLASNNNNNNTSAPQNNNRSAICKLEPKEFDGNVAEAADWLRDFNMICENNRWEDPQRYRSAKVKLTKDAKNWCLNEFRNHNDPSFTAYTTEEEPTWQVFCDKFLAHFRPPGCEYVLEEQLKFLTKKETETYTEYIMRFLTNARQANASMPDEKIVFLFKRTLNRDPIISSITNIRDLDSIKAALRNFDEIQSSDRVIKKPIEPTTRFQKNFNNRNRRQSNNKSPEPTSSGKQPLKSNIKKRTFSAPETVKCFNCGKKRSQKKYLSRTTKSKITRGVEKLLLKCQRRQNLSKESLQRVILFQMRPTQTKK